MPYGGRVNNHTCNQNEMKEERKEIKNQNINKKDVTSFQGLNISENLQENI